MTFLSLLPITAMTRQILAKFPSPIQRLVYDGLGSTGDALVEVQVVHLFYSTQNDTI